MKRQEFEAIIERVVEEKLRELLPEVIGEVFANLTQDVLLEREEVPEPRPVKRMNLRESVAMPTAPSPDVAATKQMLRDKFRNGITSGGATFTTAEVMPASHNLLMTTDPETGAPKMIPVSEVPQDLMKALTKKYTGFEKATLGQASTVKFTG